mmetsp:Transcript_5726/g.16707  ORF Transcript_5726/g.16707 Transcript_5726/m.16707 type:complete len:1148 (-) Transcript_5726:127-3570(-)
MTASAFPELDGWMDDLDGVLDDQYDILSCLSHHPGAQTAPTGLRALPATGPKSPLRASPYRASRPGSVRPSPVHAGLRASPYAMSPRKRRAEMNLAGASPSKRFSPGRLLAELSPLRFGLTATSPARPVLAHRGHSRLYLQPGGLGELFASESGGEGGGDPAGCRAPGEEHRTPQTPPRGGATAAKKIVLCSPFKSLGGPMDEERARALEEAFMDPDQDLHDFLNASLGPTPMATPLRGSTPMRLQAAAAMLGPPELTPRTSPPREARGASQSQCREAGPPPTSSPRTPTRSQHQQYLQLLHDRHHAQHHHHPRHTSPLRAAYRAAFERAIAQGGEDLAADASLDHLIPPRLPSSADHGSVRQAWSFDGCDGGVAPSFPLVPGTARAAASAGVHHRQHFSQQWHEQPEAASLSTPVKAAALRRSPRRGAQRAAFARSSASGGAAEEEALLPHAGVEHGEGVGGCWANLGLPSECLSPPRGGLHAPSATHRLSHHGGGGGSCAPGNGAPCSTPASATKASGRRRKGRAGGCGTAGVAPLDDSCTTPVNAATATPRSPSCRPHPGTSQPAAPRKPRRAHSSVEEMGDPAFATPVAAPPARGQELLPSHGGAGMGMGGSFSRRINFSPMATPGQTGPGQSGPRPALSPKGKGGRGAGTHQLGGVGNACLTSSGQGLTALSRINSMVNSRSAAAAGGSAAGDAPPGIAAPVHPAAPAARVRASETGAAAVPPAQHHAHLTLPQAVLAVDQHVQQQQRAAQRALGAAAAAAAAPRVCRDGFSLYAADEDLTLLPAPAPAQESHTRAPAPTRALAGGGCGVAHASAQAGGTGPQRIIKRRLTGGSGASQTPSPTKGTVHPSQPHGGACPVQPQGSSMPVHSTARAAPEVAAAAAATATSPGGRKFHVGQRGSRSLSLRFGCKGEPPLVSRADARADSGQGALALSGPTDPCSMSGALLACHHCAWGALPPGASTPAHHPGAPAINKRRSPIRRGTKVQLGGSAGAGPWRISLSLKKAADRPHSSPAAAPAPRPAGDLASVLGVGLDREEGVAKPSPPPAGAQGPGPTREAPQARHATAPSTEVSTPKPAAACKAQPADAPSPRREQPSVPRLRGIGGGAGGINFRVVKHAFSQQGASSDSAALHYPAPRGCGP